MDKQNFDTAAVCGLFCKSCGIYMATQTNNEMVINRIAERLQVPKDQIKCNGCRSDVLTTHCKSCNFRDCIDKKGIQFCSECDEYPCASLKEFQIQMPHRVELFPSLDQIAALGWEKWYELAQERYSCTKCNHLCGWYERECSHCGNTPSSSFAADHFDILVIKG